MDNNLALHFTDEDGQLVAHFLARKLNHVVDLPVPLREDALINVLVAIDMVNKELSEIKAHDCKCRACVQEKFDTLMKKTYGCTN